MLLLWYWDLFLLSFLGLQVDLGYCLNTFLLCRVRHRWYTTLFRLMTLRIIGNGRFLDCFLLCCDNRLCVLGRGIFGETCLLFEGGWFWCLLSLTWLSGMWSYFVTIASQIRSLALALIQLLLCFSDVDLEFGQRGLDLCSGRLNRFRREVFSTSFLIRQATRCWLNHTDLKRCFLAIWLLICQLLCQSFCQTFQPNKWIHELTSRFVRQQRKQKFGQWLLELHLAHRWFGQI